MVYTILLDVRLIPRKWVKLLVLIIKIIVSQLVYWCFKFTLKKTAPFDDVFYQNGKLMDQ